MDVVSIPLRRRLAGVSPEDDLAQLRRQVADATAQQEQARREGNGLAVALHGKEIAEAQKRIEVL